MPEKFKQALNLSIGIPMWSVVSFIAVLIFNAGVTITKLNALLENFAATTREVAIIKEKQIERGGILNSLQAQAQSHETRISALERGAIEKGR